jgi:ubiquinone biosynthesis protein
MVRKRDRVQQVAGVLGELLAGEARARWRRGRNGALDPEILEVRRAQALSGALERLGPLYIKVGQVLSTRPDIVSQATIDALQNLHEQVEVRPFADFAPVLEANLGGDWRSGFREIDTEHPLGAASIAQVYRAVRTDGTEVAVKIQRPGVAAAVRLDMEILAQAVRLVARRAPGMAEIFQPEAMLEEIFSAMRPEIDFTAEAANMAEFRVLLDRYGGLRVPEVLEATKQVLVMSKAPGVSIRECRLEDFTQAEREEIGRGIVTMVFRGFMVDGVFHGDPHPGNIFVAPGERATLIDFGIIGRIDRGTSFGYTRFMLGIALNDGEAAGRAALEMATLTSRSDVAGFLSDMQRYIPTMANLALGKMEFGSSFNQFLTFYTKRGIAVNPAIALLGKASANMEGSLRRIAPELNPFDVFRDIMGSILRDQAKRLLEGAELVRIANEAFVAGHSVPEQARYLAKSIVNGQYVLRTRDESQTVHEAREDARARALRRTLIGIAAAALWLDHRRRR